MDAQRVFRPVRVTRASEEVIQQIKAHIFDGRLAPGDQLPSERELAGQFGLSRLTIRDALRVLESQGLVEIKVGARGGAFVARPRPERVSEMLLNLLRLQVTTVEELVEARLVVETHVAALAAQRATAEDLVAMEQAIREARAGREEGEPNFIPHSVAFHLALAEAAKNQVLRFTVTSFRTLFHEALAPLLPADDMAERAVVDHQRLLDAIRARDEEGARRLMHDHLMYFAARVRRGRGKWGASPRGWM